MKEVFCDSRPHIIFAFSEFFLWDNSECFAHPPSFKHTILDNLDASPARPSCIEKTREIILKEIPRLLVYGVAGAGIYYCVTLTSGIEEHSFQAASLSSDAFLEQTESSCPSSYITNTTVPGYLNQYCDNACAFLNRTITNPEASALEEIGKVFVRLHNKTSLRRGDAPQDLETLTSTLCECVTGIFARTLNKVATCFSFIEYYSFLEGAPERLKTTTTTTTTTAQPLFNRNLDSLSGNFFG